MPFSYSFWQRVHRPANASVWRSSQSLRAAAQDVHGAATCDISSRLRLGGPDLGTWCGAAHIYCAPLRRTCMPPPSVRPTPRFRLRSAPHLNAHSRPSTFICLLVAAKNRAATPPACTATHAQALATSSGLPKRGCKRPQKSLRFAPPLQPVRPRAGAPGRAPLAAPVPACPNLRLVRDLVSNPRFCQASSRQGIALHAAVDGRPDA